MTRAELNAILKRILKQPTAPFHEQRVVAEIERFFSELGWPVGKDAYGNRVAVYKPAKKALKGRIAFVAHTDHPGFEIESAAGKRAVARWFGGVWRPYFTKAQVEVQSAAGPVKGRVVKVKSPSDAPNRVETMELKMDGAVAPGDFGQWDLPLFKMDGKLITTRAADDLCSVVAMLALARECQRRDVRHEVWFVFTRAEENGFNGCMGLIEGKMLPPDLAMISLETSKALPGAEQGKGPVIRLGDRLSTYSHELLLYMENQAQKLKKDQRGFSYARKVMDGGACEASVFINYGYTTAGIAFPLGNYHNMGDAPGPDGKPVLRAETVHIEDLSNGIELMVAMCANLAQLPLAVANVRKRLVSISKPYYKKLKENVV
jgi:endoglucanase